jgi:N-acyl-D-aspartate/D-glutamate deacylase
MTADLVIRNGTVVDGTGGAVRRADVAIEDGVITDVGDGIGRGRRELDADGLMVTPGFVDPHTHYDGQATWDAVLAPSAHHGVTTVAMGNCGVGFAPVAPDRHDWLIEMMEGVEDIPGTALHEGLRWDWESFPQYLDALDRQPRTIDVGTHVPHAALRAFVMGERGADPAEHPDVGELDDMAALLGEGLDAGAIGVSTSRTERHRTSRGENLGTLHAREPELMALASVLAERDCGVFQFLSDSYRTTDDEFARSEFELVAAFARASSRTLPRPSGGATSWPWPGRSRQKGSMSRRRWLLVRSACCSDCRRRSMSSPRHGPTRRSPGSPSASASRRCATPNAAGGSSMGTPT